MKMKKVLALALAMVMSLGLTACSGSNAPAEESKQPESSNETTPPGEEGPSGDAVDITLWTYPIGGWGKEEQVQGLLASFNEKYPDINVTVEYLDYTNGDDQVNTAIEGGQAPDLIMEGPERLVANWGAKGYMVDLADMWTDSVKADVYDAVESACQTADGKFYEYPLCMTAHNMAINRDVFEAAGALQYLDEETRTWTTENFLKAVEAVYAYNGGNTVGVVYCGGQGGDQGTRALVNNLYGGTFTDAAHTVYTADSAENIKALETLYGQEGIEFDASLVGGTEIELFVNGTLSMAFCWNIAQETNNMDKLNFDAMPMCFPSDDGQAELCGGIWGFGIFDNGDAAKIEAAKTFIDFMANDADGVADAVRASTYWPVKESVGNIYEGDAMMTEYGQFMSSMGDYYQVVPGWAEARTAWWNMLQQVGAGEDVVTAVGTFVSTANAAAQG